MRHRENTQGRDLIEVTIQESEIEVVEVDGLTVLRILNGSVVFNVCLAAVAVVELVSALTVLA